MQMAMKRRGAFSLIELVVVVVILGLIATIAIPRVSRGAEGAAEASLRSDLSRLRSAISTYQAEHGGEFPELANMPEALTQYSASDGATSATPDSTHIYGPYLSAIPTMKLGENKGLDTIDGSEASGTAWVYDETTGEIYANAAGTDDAGTDYKDY